jgi:magnesium transporter
MQAPRYNMTMISKYKYKKLTWVDIENPTTDEINHIIEEFNVPTLVGEEIVHTSLHPKVDVYPNVLYLILHFPKLSREKGKATEQEIDFIIGKDFIITAHYEFIDSINEFAKKFEAESVLEKHMDIDHAGFLFFHLVDTLYSNTRHQLSDINLMIRDTEHKIFKGKESEMVTQLSTVNRMLLDFKQSLRFHHQVLNSFEIAGKKFFGQDFSYYLSAIIGEFIKTESIMDSHKEIIDDLRETNDSLLSSKTNETMRVLTIITFITSPVMVISSVFMMNTNFILIDGAFEFILLVGIMLFASIIIFIYFKLKKWL